MASSGCFGSGRCVSPEEGLTGTEGAPTAGISSSAAVPRWADLVDDAPEGQVQSAEWWHAVCNGDANGAPGGDSDCSTSAWSGCSKETFRECWPDLASDEEVLGPQPGPGFVASAARVPMKSSRWRPKAKIAAAPRASRSSSSAASNYQPAGRSVNKQSRAQSSWDGWKDKPASNNSSSWKGAWKSNSAWKSECEWRSEAAGSWRGDRDSELRTGRRAESKQQCQFTIGIEEEPTFHVVGKVLGLHGQHVKRIAQESGAKLRLRGRGSGFKEGPEQEESGDPLMLCVSAPDARSYGIAVKLLRHHLEDVYSQYRDSFEDKAAGLSVSIHEGPRDGSR